MRLLISVLFVPSALFSQDFDREIRPLLKERCVECHGPEKQKADLRLDAKPHVFKGGESGAAIIAARGLSSAASAANAACDTIRSLTSPTPTGDWTSVAVCSDGSYGIDKGLMFSFPIRTDGSKWEIVQGVPVNEFSQARIKATEDELKEERVAVTELGLI